MVTNYGNISSYIKRASKLGYATALSLSLVYTPLAEAGSKTSKTPIKQYETAKAADSTTTKIPYSEHWGFLGFGARRNHVIPKKHPYLEIKQGGKKVKSGWFGFFGGEREDTLELRVMPPAPVKEIFIIQDTIPVPKIIHSSTDLRRQGYTGKKITTYKHGPSSRTGHYRSPTQYIPPTIRSDTHKKETPSTRKHVEYNAIPDSPRITETRLSPLEIKAITTTVDSTSLANKQKKGHSKLFYGAITTGVGILTYFVVKSLKNGNDESKQGIQGGQNDGTGVR